jgi:drug/metabolite transporter (DMT)-like permease
MRGIGVLLLTLLCVLLTTAAQIALKVGVASPQLQSWLASGRWQNFLLHALWSPLVMFGLALYVLGALMWLLVLARADLSYAYPFVSVGFIATTLYAFYVLNEPLGFARLSGIVLIVGGLALIASS